MFNFTSKSDLRAKIAELRETVRIQSFGLVDLQLRLKGAERYEDSMDGFMQYLAQNVPDFEKYVLAHMEQEEGKTDGA